VLATDADVDRVVTGTLLRSGDQLRVVAQLVEAPGGAVVTSETVQAPLGDLFQLQDDITRRVVAALSLPLGGATPSPSPDVPQNPRAYELYLRANEMGRTYDNLLPARDLYERCVALDPGFAPAWARLGRCHRVVGKYIRVTPGSEAAAEDAYRRALEINPRLTIAHKLYAALEADTGKSVRAIARLVGEATRHGNDAELFAGLVHACRYCGLLEESITSAAEAKRLDPNIETSVAQTLLLTGDLDRLLAISVPGAATGADDVFGVIGLGLAGRRDEARERLSTVTGRPHLPLFRIWMAHVRSWLDQRPNDMMAGIEELSALAVFEDPESQFNEGWLFCDVGQFERGLPYLERAIDRGYFPVATLTRSPQFDGLRDHPTFQSLVNDAVAGRDRALAAFKQAGGDRLFGR
jgi:tetratricopeptide (TPR) repeat protein